MNDTKYIEIHGVEQAFKTPKGRFVALRDVNLNVAKGEFITLIGHSGCGKSTLLNLIAGLTTPTDYMNVAKVLNLSEWKILTKILFPAVLPYMLTGVRLAVGLSLIHI